jgi:hypothetical protein
MSFRSVFIALHTLGKHLPEEDATPEQQRAAASD